MSWFKAPKWATGLNCNIFTQKCMLFNGQDCMYASDPNVCISEGPGFAWDRCLAEPEPGTRAACDVLSYNCKLGGREDHWLQWVGMHYYYWMLTEKEKDDAVRCYEGHKQQAEADLEEFQTDKVEKLRQLGTFICGNGPPEFVLAAVGTNLNSCPGGYTHVLTRQSCQDAGGMISGLNGEGPRDCTGYNGGRHGSSGMRGCTINTNNNCLHFNVENLQGACRGSGCHAESRYVCRYGFK